MEDIAKSKRQAFCRAITMTSLLGLLINPLCAATQGNLGSKTSYGSISISLSIPENVQLIAKHSHSLAPDSRTQICLDIIDNFSSQSTGFYTLAGINGDLNADYGLGETHYENTSRVIQVENSAYNLSDIKCDYSTSIVKHSSSQDKEILLILIAE